MSKRSYFKPLSLAQVPSLGLFDPQIGPKEVGQSGPESDVNEGIYRILQRSSITGTPASDHLK